MQIWQASYPAGTPTTLDFSELNFKNLADLLDQSIRKYPKKTAFHCFSHDLTYETWGKQAAGLAHYFKTKTNLKAQDRLGIMLPNVLTFPIVFLAALQAELLIVPINPQCTWEELKCVQADAQLQALVYFAGSPLLNQHSLSVGRSIFDLNIPYLYAVLPGDGLPWYKKSLLHANLRKKKLWVPPPTGLICLQDVLRKGLKSLTGNPTAVASTQSTPAVLQYTGGTTGTPKAAVLTHGNLIANILQAHSWTQSELKFGQEIVITPLPLYHVFSLTANFLLFTYLGGNNVLIANPKDLLNLVKTLQRFKFTAITGVSTLFAMLVQNKTFRTLEFSSLKIAMAGGMPLHPLVAQQWQAITGKPLLEGYGLTEASPIVCVNPLSLTQYTGSIGLPLPNTEVSLRNEKGEPVSSLDEVGELWIKGPQVMWGYWERPEETATVLTADGWLKTGDLAMMDEAGFLTIVDRLKDLIIVAGFNVYPTEIEAIIAQCPGVKEVGVVGIQDRGRGEQIKAVVVKEDPLLQDHAILDHCKKHLAPYKYPKIIEFRDILPKSNVGKILRRDLK